MNNEWPTIPKPVNEPVLDYVPGSSEREALERELLRLAGEKIDIPCVIGGREVRSGDLRPCIQPHDLSSPLGAYHAGGTPEAEAAVSAALEAKPAWEELPFQERAKIFLKAADLLSGRHRMTLNAATMLNQSKNAFQAEIDAACELADFWRFNAWFMQTIYGDQPLYSPPGVFNSADYRPLEGFVFAVTPFNFTSIGGNLPTAPAMMGNTVVWKPASAAVYSAHFIMEILKEAGLPDGVINLVPGPGGRIGDPVMSSDRFAGIHFTGSTEVFGKMWGTIGANISRYRSYPRIVGETGGKNFLVAHASADLDALVTAVVRGAFEYQGQKCSALSRMYVPRGMWPELSERLIETLTTVRIGPVQDFGNFMNAVIDRPAFEETKGYIERAAASADAEIVFGGGCKDGEGYYIEPTVILTRDPRYETMVEEIFAPILTVFLYEDGGFDDALTLCDGTGTYGLTGSIFARDRYAIERASSRLRHAAGNFYINDKPTGAVVGQQPFGGGRSSGTNDKAGSMMNLLRWTSMRAIKENFVPPSNYRYPFMG